MRKYISLPALEPIDLRILGAVQRNGRISNVELSLEVGLSPAPCWRRLKRLEAQRFILGYQANLNRRLLGYSVCAYVFLDVSTHAEHELKSLERSLMNRPEVAALQVVTGKFDLVLQVVTATMDEYVEFIDGVVRQLPLVNTFYSSLILREVRGQGFVPLMRD
ncbi:Lrp/AsnC family transcriptional regulator [Pseudomonas sp. TNT2022 ID681]|uniref:Lrp/AsnC family transcriptional regulator n=1 Tax=Pseudomonas fontis TaxID=2942633 RepID=A0ABT5NYN2_9PSED|nr:Lrp/AsnC family transcriptional regulator [Pseudomonas fontis]MDD0993309.1 Lrp/AsnC family transcriptional regulator [Pseudomonas fontis]